MKVVAPQAHVDYGLANLIGVDSVEVSARGDGAGPHPAAQPMNSVLPMWLPATCVYGPLAGDVAANPAPSASPTYTCTPGSTRARSQRRDRHPGLRAVRNRPTRRSPSSSTTCPKDRTWAVIRFTFGDTQYVDYLVTFPMTPANNSTVTVTIADLDADDCPPGARQRHGD